ncbi:MAG: Eco57I restriction-modification methylase domain-containing protein [Candidatus Eremiobacteraeota bacterium]|nr:Eco57I restriction-modification methylase domain-containing protein [Candidatus Eremiobacteraeota bacterium]
MNTPGINMDETLSEDFFRGYEKIFNHVKKVFREKSGDIKWAHYFSHQLLSRLLFLCFIQKKEWLGKDQKFIIKFYRTYQKLKKANKIEADSFYEDWLSVLFFQALCGNVKGCQRPYFSDKISSAIILAPYLNSRLFKINDFDNRLHFTIPDEIFDTIFEFLERYNFTIREELPLDAAVAVDPEMIGRVYESLVNISEDTDERAKAGIFYTDRTEIDFMCRRSLVEYLWNNLTNMGNEKWEAGSGNGNGKELLYDFIFAAGDSINEIDEKISKIKLWNGIITLLENITVVDPACGSGSFLVGMLNILYGLLKRAYSYSQNGPPADFNIKKSIIGKSLYGIDIKEWAVNIAELRLWLQLIIETDLELEEHHSSKPLLPSFSFNLSVGDFLAADIGGLGICKKAQNRFAVLDPAFIEILSGETKGFDVVIGNPPYVRQENIAPPSLDSAKITTDIKKKYKDRIINKIKHLYPGQINKIEKRSDLYIYFYFNGLHLLNKNGVFCFITSNSWLDVGYGKNLQEFLLKYVRIHAIYDNSAKRSFSHADVNTIIALFSAPVYREKEALKNIARFVQFRKPFEEVINLDNLKEIEKMKSRGHLREGKGKREEGNGKWEMGKGKREAESGKREMGYGKDGESTIARVVPMTQQELLLEGWEFPEEENVIARSEATKQSQSKKTKKKLSSKSEKEAFVSGKKTGVPKSGKFAGDRWGGKYLRAPDIFFTILEKGRKKLVRLGDIAKIRRGFTTGCNEFFYLPGRHFDIKKTDDGRYWKLIPKHEGLPVGMMIEDEYLVPIIKSAKNSSILLLKRENLSTYILKFKNNENIEKKCVNNYIKWGEENKFQNISSVKNRKLWYDVGHKDACDAIILRRIGERMPVFEANGFLEDCCLFGIKFFQRSSIEQNIALLNSSFVRLLIELNTRELTGAQAVADTNVCVIKEIPAIKQNVISNEDNNELKRIWQNMRKRESCSFFVESGIDISIPIRQQQPNPLPDRKALDNIAFKTLNLTDEERKEVYWSVCELVKDRLDKAKSV